MSWLLHRDACVAVIRGVPRASGRFAQWRGQAYISAVTVTVLELWLMQARTPTRFLQGYGAIFQQFHVLNVDDSIAHRAAAIGSSRGPRQLRLTTVDLIVAATAVIHGLTLVTHDGGHFASIAGLSLVDWMVP